MDLVLIAENEAKNGDLTIDRHPFNIDEAKHMKGNQEQKRDETRNMARRGYSESNFIIDIRTSSFI